MWWSKFINSFHSRKLDDELTEELNDHLQRRTASLNADGLTAEEAVRRANIRFGNRTRIAEESREFHLVAWLETGLQDLRYTWRGLRKSPAFACTAIVSLALAIGANSAIYSILDAAILRSLPVPHPDELLLLSSTPISDPGVAPGDERYSFSYPAAQQFVELSAPLARLVFSSEPNIGQVQPSDPGAPAERVLKQYISGTGFSALGMAPALGRLFSADDDRLPPGRPTVVLSFDYWKRHFHGSPAALGRYLTVDSKSYEVTGVAREGFFGVDPGKPVDIWMPATQYTLQAFTSPNWHWLRLMARMSNGNSPAALQARLQPEFHEMQVQSVQTSRSMPQAIKDQFLHAQLYVRSGRSGVPSVRNLFSKSLWIVFAVGGAILLIACANVASLLLARAHARGPEMALRLSLGAARGRLARQMLTESLLLSFLAGAAGWLMARALAPLLVRMLSAENNPVRFDLATDTRVLFFCIAISTLSALIFGLAPAWQASGAKPILSIRASAGQSSKLQLGKLFVGLQVACAFCLVMVGAGFLFSLANLFRVQPGFDPHGVSVISLQLVPMNSAFDPLSPNDHKDLRSRMLSDMLQLQAAVQSRPGIQSAAFAMWPIFSGGGWSQQVFLPGKAPSDREEIFYRVSPGYFSTLRTPLLSGREFVASDSSASNHSVVIVNASFARKYFDSVDVIGREFSRREGPVMVRHTIAGVSADARYYDVRHPADPIVYFPPEASSNLTLYIRSTIETGSLAQMVLHDARSIRSGAVIREVTTLDQLVGNTLLREKLLAAIGGAFSFFGLLLAGIGLFGLLNYSVGRRFKEMGIRSALGARRSGIVALVLREVTALLAGGFFAGLLAAGAAMALLRSLLFGIRTVDPIVTTTAIMFFLVTGLGAAAIPAYRAATVDPVRALREE